MNHNKAKEYDYIIGADRSLKEIIKDSDVMPLFHSAIKAGVSYIALEGDDEKILYRCGDIPGTDFPVVKKPLYLEGEIVGYIVVIGCREKENIIKTISELIYDVINIILKNSFKTLLAAEAHKTVVHQSFDELLETNRKLKLSEAKYRELAKNLEKEVQQRTEELKHAHAKLLHQEKMISVGQLAAGIAHEINNPLGFILSNINTLNQYTMKMKDMLVFYRGILAKNELTSTDREASDQKWSKYKLDPVMSDIDDLIKESLSGAERVKKIVSDLKGFSHIDEAHEVDTDINREIDRTISVLIHEIPQYAEILRDFQPLPPFLCNPADICQAFFNIILNAFQECRRKPKLVITTRHINGHIKISFSDNGPGIPENIKNRIFEPFFTTKEVGKGTGMGLNVTYEIVTSYGGTIDVDSRPGHGATFSILLPLIQRERDVKVR